jgi:hypothetical protein
MDESLLATDIKGILQRFSICSSSSLNKKNYHHGTTNTKKDTRTTAATIHGIILLLGEHSNGCHALEWIHACAAQSLS